jgi:hypothetical protein
MGTLTRPPTDFKLAWAARLKALAVWARRRYFARRDRYGGYYRKGGETHPCTKPQAGPEDGCVTDELLKRHFCAASPEDVVGAHVLASGGGGRLVAIDIDAHAGTTADPAANERFAQAIHAEIVSLGLHPLTYESNGRGGYHVVVFFASKWPDWVPGYALHGFGQWLVRR